MIKDFVNKTVFHIANYINHIVTCLKHNLLFSSCQKKNQRFNGLAPGLINKGQNLGHFSIIKQNSYL